MLAEDNQASKHTHGHAHAQMRAVKVSFASVYIFLSVARRCVAVTMLLLLLLSLLRLVSSIFFFRAIIETLKLPIQTGQPADGEVKLLVASGDFRNPLAAGAIPLRSLGPPCDNGQACSCLSTRLTMWLRAEVDFDSRVSMSAES